MPVSFLWPSLLVLLLAWPVGVGLYVFWLRERQRRAAAFSALGLRPPEADQRPARRQHLPVLFFLLALACLLTALARPQADLSLPRVEGTVILVLDVSGSMAAGDLQPSRLEAAKAAAVDFVQRQPATVRIGLVAFSDNGFSVQAPTDEKDELLASLKRLTPQRGTSLGQGIVAALSVIAASQAADAPRFYTNREPTPTFEPTPMPAGVYSSAVIVLLSDGENNENPDPLTAAQAAADRGVRIHTVGLGSQAGADLEIEGFTVHTQLDEAQLQQIALLTDGEYYRAEAAEALPAIYDDLVLTLVTRSEPTEMTALLAGAGSLLLLLGGLLSLIWWGRLP